MRNVYRLICNFYCLLIFSTGFAQETLQGNGKPEMAVGMRSNGKIYVVIAVVLTILLGMFIYLVNLDRKIGRLEKEARNEANNLRK
ncbi:MAG: CcmD family protein [Chitinophagaceae bacterium]